MTETTPFDAKRVRFGIAVTTAVSGEGGSAQRMREQAAEFCRRLSDEELGFVPQVSDDYPALLDALRAGELDVAWLPPVVALRATSFGHALPIALPVRGGECAFHSALFAKPDSPLGSLRDLKGARVAWVDRFSASGYLVMRAALRAEALNVDSAFSDEMFAGSHEAAVEAVLSGKADVGASFAHFDAAGAVTKAGWGGRSVRIIHSVGPIPGDVIAASVRVPVVEIRRVQNRLVSGIDGLSDAASALMGAERFAEAEAAHLAPLDGLLNFLEGMTFKRRSVFPPSG